jgi:isoaspartyl peptidase/L-asparaginase-like protein (Ntn-hydrolase superfamily)
MPRPLALTLGFLLVGCSTRAEPIGELPAAAAQDPTAHAGLMIVAHGGQGSPASRSDGPAAAVEAVRTALDAEEAPMEAAIRGIVIMEDDPRFNAGTGANLRLDGKTIECDAAIMDDEGNFGAVAGLAGIKNPILVARAVVDSPHILMAGPGARAFADTLGLQSADLGTDYAKRKIERGWSRLLAGDRWSDYDWRSRWNFETPAPTDMDGVKASLADPQPDPTQDEGDTKDTVGVVLRTAEGRYAAALSTGGTTLALRGRVGDVPQLGAGLYVGPSGAVAATGKGEAITRERVAAEVYALLEQGVHPREAIRRAARGVTRAEGVGVIAVSERGYGAWATTQMAWAAAVGDASERADLVVTRD